MIGDLLARLVAIDSVNPSLVAGGAGEAEIAAFVAEWAAAAGLEVDVVEETPGRPSVVVPCDMPLVPPALLEVLLEVVEGGAPAALPRTEGRVHPLCAAYAPAALPDLEAAERDEPLTLTLDRLGATVLAADAAADRMLNVNTRADLAVAEILLGRG